MLYNTFAVNTIASNINDNVYDIDINEDTIITIPKNTSKTIYFHIKNTNNGTIKYAVAYNTSSTIDIKVYNDSKDKVSDTIGYGDNKYIKLHLNNSTSADNTITISCVLGYENGGDLIVPDGITLVTEIYTPPANLAKYITNLYTSATKSTVTNNSIEYNYASSVSLMNDRLGGTTDSLDGGNIRYYGANPNNYIYFNCEEYPDTNCEIWRIVGVFDGKLKLIRSESIGLYSWDTMAKAASLLTKPGINEWSQADAMKLLNPGYESESVGGSLYYNSKSGTCYNGTKNATTSCDFTSSGIKNDTTRSKIAEVTFYTGGANSDDITDGYSNTIYQKERGTEVISSPKDGITRLTSWNGRLALPYPSDYTYATDFNICSSTIMHYDDSGSSYGCRSNDWIYPILGTSNNSWALTPTSLFSFEALYIEPDGSVMYSTSKGPTYQPFDIVPTLYLNATETMVDKTTGTEDTPYQLNP